MSDVRFHFEWLTPLDWAFLAAMVLLLMVLVVIAVRGAARERELRRQRQQAWAWQYFRGGGLVRALLSRWQGTPRLTDQRGDSEGNR